MDSKHEELVKAHEEETSHHVNYSDMVLPWGSQWHQTTVTVMGQVNQALTGYGAVSVYGPQIFELLGLEVALSEYLTQANYVSYFFLMTFAWLLIDRVGRRILMVGGAFGISFCFLLMTILGGLAQNADNLKIPVLPVTAVGGVALFIATGLFGIAWLTQPWLIPTEIYPATSRAQGAAISVVIWGIANFVVTLLTPIGFNKLSYWLFLIFAATNLFAAWWTWVSCTLGDVTARLGALLTFGDRLIAPRLAGVRLKKTRSSSSTQRRKTPGLSPTSIMESTKACRRKEKAMTTTGKLNHCSGMAHSCFRISNHMRSVMRIILWVD